MGELIGFLEILNKMTIIAHLLQLQQMKTLLTILSLLKICQIGSKNNNKNY